MIKTVCAWVLVVLAASPVTSPFSTCDLRAFFTPKPIVGATMSPSTALRARLSIDADAHGVSPLVSRHELAAETPPGACLIFPFSGDSITARDIDRPDDIKASVHARTARPLVLRL
jgi:hypothetical protein